MSIDDGLSQMRREIEALDSISRESLERSVRRFEKRGREDNPRRAPDSPKGDAPDQTRS
jgi:hypothetical protein